MIRRFHKQSDPRRDYRINERIFSRELRVLDAEGKQIGVLSKDEALRLAREMELDLVEVAQQAVPPVARIIDFNKFLYQQAKKKQEEKRKAKVSETKEVRMGPHMHDNDLQVVIEKVRSFLEDGDKVRLVVKFRGRQIVHPEFGFNMIKKLTDALSDIVKIEKEPKLEGKQLMAVIAFDKKGKQKPSESVQEQTL